MRGMDAKIPYRESRSPRHIRVSATQPRTQTFLPLPIASLFCCFFSGTVVYSPILIFLQNIAKTGSLCCVAARPHGSNAASREWSMGPNEPYWRTNTSFSPPPSRWDFRVQPEGLSFGSHDGIQLYGSSTSSNSRGSRSWVRGNHVSNHQYSTSDGVGPYFSSPSEISPARQWTPPTIQEIRVDDYATSSRRAKHVKPEYSENNSVQVPHTQNTCSVLRVIFLAITKNYITFCVAVLGPLSFSPTMEGTSTVQDSRGSTSSRSDSSDYEPMARSHLSSHRNFSSRRCFMSKPIHPLSFPSEAPTREAADTTATGFSEFDTATPRREMHRLSSASGSIDFTDVAEPLESDSFGRSCNPPDSFKCGLCERFLSQRSPWSSRRIVKSGDMPVAGVLSCRHVFHAECLEQTTPKMRKNDPPCPLCVRSEDENSPEQRVFSKLRNGFPKLRTFSEDGPSRPWGCSQAGDCVEGALHAPPRNTMLLLNRNRVRKNFPSKGNPNKEFPGKLRKIGSYSSPLLIGRSVEQGAVGSSKTTPGTTSMKL
ncbi:unnamed protein product [Camellia sinensis]